MKKSLSIVLAVVTLVMLTGCVSTKKIVYFQETDDVFREGQQIMQQYEMRLKPADQILVKVTCSEPQLLEIFAQDVTMGSTGNTSNISNAGSLTNSYGYTVSGEGNVVLPAVGSVHVAGLTSEQTARVIEERIVNANLIKDPEVTVRLLNARVAVLGAVKNPQVVNLTSERNTVLDILSQCGDIGDTGLRQNITLYREENGVRKKYPIDLTSADVFTNEAFYVQQNDLIYVEPNKSQSIKSSAFYTFLGAGSAILGVISSVLAIVVLATK